MTKMDKHLAHTLAVRLRAACDEIAKEYGLTVHYGGGRFDAGQFRPTLTFDVASPLGAHITAKAQAEWEGLCEAFGLERGDLGQTFTTGGEMFQILGLAPRARKMAVMARNVETGTMHRFCHRGVSALLRLAKAGLL